MWSRRWTAPDQAAGRPAFTLVELLTVVAIIALLVGILVPAVSAVRRNARNTASQTVLGSLSTAIDAFKADQRVGGAYPPSASDCPRNVRPPGQFNVMNPYRAQGVPGEAIRMTGAGLLVWALAGADLLGTPGFRPFNPSSQYWSQDTKATEDDANTAYGLSSAGRRPLNPRAGPYVDLSKVRVTRFNTADKSFDIEAEVEARQRSGLPRVNRTHPMFLDAFGFPILYWRADPAGSRLADAPSRRILDHRDPEKRGIYHSGDNDFLIGPPLDGGGPDLGDPQILVLRPTKEDLSRLHKIRHKDPGTDDAKDIDQNANFRGFWKYVRNKDVSIRLTPQNPDTYLLASPGEDGIFGTADDITNFDHNGAETARDP